MAKVDTLALAKEMRTHFNGWYDKSGHKEPPNGTMGAIFDNGKATWYLNGACHGPFKSFQSRMQSHGNYGKMKNILLGRGPENSDNQDKKGIVQYIVTCMRNCENKKRGAGIIANRVKHIEGYTVPFLDWLINRSLWAPIFVTKDAEEGLKEGLILNADVPANLLLGALQTSRHPWEFPTIIRFFVELVQAGMHEDLAWLFANGTTVQEDGTILFSRGIHSYRTLDMQTMDLDTMHRFMRHDPPKGRINKSYIKGGGTTPVVSIWNGASDWAHGATTNEFYNLFKIAYPLPHDVEIKGWDGKIVESSQHYTHQGFIGDVPRIQDVAMSIIEGGDK